MTNLRLHIIWDLDGTLIDSNAEVVEHLERSVEKAGVSSSLKERELRIGPTLNQMILDAYPQISMEKIKEITTYFRQSYDFSDFNKTQPFEGIEDILSKSSYINHIVTNKPSFPTQRLLEKFGWTSHFKTVRSPYIKDEITIAKKDLMKEIMNEFSLSPQNVISIGDMATDAIAAKTNGIKAIGVLWGAGTEDELRPVCDVLISHPKEIKFLYE